MPHKKTLHLDEIGLVEVTKKRHMKSIRLRVNHDNTISVSAPWFISLLEIKAFVRAKSEWIRTHQTNESFSYRDGMQIGRSGKISVVYTSNKTSRVYLVPGGVEARLGITGSLLDQKASLDRQVIKYLQQETEAYIFPRLLKISEVHNLTFNQLKTKRLTGRWGSCDSHKDITINCFLVQLDDKLIDYVVAHELAHTRHMNHSHAFWDEVEAIIPDYKVRRTALKEYSPRIYDMAGQNTL